MSDQEILETKKGRKRKTGNPTEEAQPQPQMLVKHVLKLKHF